MMQLESRERSDSAHTFKKMLVEPAFPPLLLPLVCGMNCTKLLTIGTTRAGYRHLLPSSSNHRHHLLCLTFNSRPSLTAVMIRSLSCKQDEKQVVTTSKYHRNAVGSTSNLTSGHHRHRAPLSHDKRVVTAVLGRGTSKRVQRLRK